MRRSITGLSAIRLFPFHGTSGGAPRLWLTASYGASDTRDPSTTVIPNTVSARFPTLRCEISEPCRPQGLDGALCTIRLGTDGLHDSLLEEAGFELVVPRQKSRGFLEHPGHRGCLWQRGDVADHG